MSRRLVAAALLALAGCSTKAATSPADGAPSPAPPPSSAAPVAASVQAPPAAAASASTSATASASVSATASATASAAPSAEPEAPLPKVGVTNIGMHIGGGPNDDVTKDPIRKSVAPHFDEFRRCFGRADDLAKAGDFGVDLRIDRAGGKGKDFKECVVHTFEAIDFLKPRGGTTTVSYSLRFTPGR
jgi:hypothetical protein